MPRIQNDEPIGPKPGTRITGKRTERPTVVNDNSDSDVATPAAAPRNRKGGKNVLSSSQKKGNKNINQLLGSPEMDEEDDDYGTPTATQIKKVGILSSKDLVAQVVQYFFVVQTKKVPVKKSEIIKVAMNRQSSEFKTVIDEVKEVLHNVFGCKLIGLKTNSETGCLEKSPSLIEGNLFMLTSEMARSLAEYGDTSVHEEVQVKRGLLEAVINCIFMLGCREVDEEAIWQMFIAMEACEMVCPRREDFRKYLKTEMVDPMYLNRIEVKNVDSSVFRYSWGIRAEMESNKWEILKHVAQSMKMQPQDFKNQFFNLMSDEKYKEIISKEINAPQRDNLFENQTDNENEEIDLIEIPESPKKEKKNVKKDVKKNLRLKVQETEDSDSST